MGNFVYHCLYSKVNTVHLSSMCPSQLIKAVDNLLRWRLVVGRMRNYLLKQFEISCPRSKIIRMWKENLRSVNPPRFPGKFYMQKWSISNGRFPMPRVSQLGTNRTHFGRLSFIMGYSEGQHDEQGGAAIQVRDCKGRSIWKGRNPEPDHRNTFFQGISGGPCIKETDNYFLPGPMAMWVLTSKEAKNAGQMYSARGTSSEAPLIYASNRINTR